MRRQFWTIGKAVIAVFLLFLLWSAGGNLSKLQELERLGIYDLGAPLDRKAAENLLNQAGMIEEEDVNDGEEKENNREKENTAAGEYPHDVLFFTEKKKQYVENPVWYRRAQTTAVEILGDSTLLFPFAYPLEAGDVYGCLLGEESAWELFGGTEVIGEEIVYKGRVYEIRGILPERNILVIEGGEDVVFSYAGIWGETLLQKDKRIGELQNLGGIFLTEIPFRFYGSIVRLEIVLTAACLYGLAGFLICRRFKEKKGVKKAVLLAAVPCIATGIVFVLSITAYKMPDKVSDMSWWGNYFTEERRAWDSFFGREELFLQEDYKKYIANIKLSYQD